MSPNFAVSAIVTAYNCADFLGQAIDSMLAQTLPPAEVILVDDGSTDDGATAWLAQGYGDQVRYLPQANSGIGAARNAGAAAARGTHLAWLDGDDYWTVDKLERQAEAFAADLTLDAAFCYVEQFVSPELKATSEAAALEVPAGPMAGRYASTLLITRTAFERVGPFATDLAISEFIDWYARAGERGMRMVMLPQVLVWRRIHAGNNSRRHQQERSEYARVLKAALDRRRAAGGQGGSESGGP